jgi:hypothetical protein
MIDMEQSKKSGELPPFVVQATPASKRSLRPHQNEKDLNVRNTSNGTLSYA